MAGTGPRRLNRPRFAAYDPTCAARPTVAAACRFVSDPLRTAASAGQNLSLPNPRRRFVPSRILATLVLVAALSGCSGAAPLATPHTLAPSTAAPGEGLGRLEGTVTDVEQRPLGDVKVTIQFVGGTANQSAQTRGDGRFAFQGLEPGRYNAAAESVFYQTGRKIVDVSADDVATVSFVLLDVIKDVPFVDVYLLKGHINCSIHSLAGYGPFNLCSSLDSDRARFDVPIPPGSRAKGVVLEVVWTPSTPATGTDLELALCDQRDPVQDPIACRATVGSGFRRDVRGRSPLTLHENELPLQDHAAFEVTVNDGGQTSARVPLTLQQPFDLWMSVCHVVACAESYQARPS